MKWCLFIISILCNIPSIIIIRSQRWKDRVYIVAPIQLSMQIYGRSGNQLKDVRAAYIGIEHNAEVAHVDDSFTHTCASRTEQVVKSPHLIPALLDDPCVDGESEFSKVRGDGVPPAGTL